MKRLNVKLPDDFHARMKVCVALERTEISDVIRDFLAKYIAEIEKKHHLKK